MQKYTSAGTSVNIIDKVHKVIVKHNLFNKNDSCLDYGGGKFESNTEFFKSNSIKNFVYDLFNRDEKHNNKIEAMYDFCIISNVLNVIEEDSVILDILTFCASHAPVVYIGVYEGNKSGVGRVSKKDCWQRNKKLVEYMPLVKKVFPDSYIKYDMIIARTAK